MKLAIILLIWVLIGAVSLCFAWISKHKKYIKQNNFKNLGNNNYFFGLLFGLVLGAFSYPVYWFANKKAPEDK